MRVRKRGRRRGACGGSRRPSSHVAQRVFVRRAKRQADSVRRSGQYRLVPISQKSVGTKIVVRVLAFPFVNISEGMPPTTDSTRAAQLFHFHHRVVFRYVRAVTGDEEEAGDITQEVFLRLLDGRGNEVSYHPFEAFKRAARKA
jgi:hypothetical protein